MITKNTYGSEWRRWDLHIHTPESGMANGFSNWDSYIKSLFTKAIEKKIAVIGVTDYFTIDGYKKIKEYLADDQKLASLFGQDQELISKIHTIRILPNIEFRLNKLVNNRRINYHIIFSDEINENEIEENFLHEIDFIIENAPQDTPCIRKLKRRNIEDLGRKIKQQQTTFTGSDFNVGCSTVLVDDCQIQKILKSHKDIFEGKYFIVIPVDEDLSDISWTSQEHMSRKNLYQQADMFFSSNKKTRDFGLGIKSSSIPSFLSEFRSFKPCIHGSDAHNEEDLFIPKENRFCWIKADPTFDGLKQIIYEPEQRVRIQEQKPEEKNDYQIIDSITFNNQDMGKQTIFFNQNLNTIIGGRSSGKSLLLGCLVKTIDPSKTPKSEDSSYNRYVDSLCQDINVNWRNNSTQSNKIIYYSQSQISDSVRTDENGISGINDLIERIVKSKTGLESILNAYEEFKISNRSSINSLINDFCDLKNQINEVIQKIEDIGSLEGIKKEITKISDKITEIKSGMSGNLSSKEEETFNNQKKELDEKKKQIEQIENDLIQINNAKEKISFPSISFLTGKLSEKNKSILQDKYSEIKQEFEKQWNCFLDEILTSLNTEKSTLSLEIEKLTKNEVYIRGIKFESGNQVLVSQNEALEAEQTKLHKIECLQKEKEALTTRTSNLKKEIFDGFNQYKKKAEEISQKILIKKDEVEIKANHKFLKSDFFDSIRDIFNKKNQAAKQIETLIQNQDYTNPLIQPEIIFENIISEIIPLKKDFQQTLVNLFAQNYYKISYDVKHGNDYLNQMSEGKKAYIVLRLLLDFDENSSCPIIIDQPEDDLDNRAIYGDLVKYIREQKTKRQIILATHNPNVVIGADAELVIVANQHGCNSKNQNDVKFEYYANSIENSFIDSSCETILLSKGIREHICEILEGGEEAFKKREQIFHKRIS